MTKKIQYFSQVLIIFTFLFGKIPPILLYNITDQMHASLQHGDIILKHIESKNGPGEHYHGYILIEESMENVFQAISQLEDYPQFMPHVAKVESLNKKQPTHFRYFIELPMGITYQYQISTVIYESSKSSWLTWKLEDWEENDIKDTWGQWVLSSYPKTNFILVQYQVYTDVGNIPFGLGWVVDLLTEYSLPDILISTKEYVEADD